MNAAFRTLTIALLLGSLLPPNLMAARFGTKSHEKAREVWMQGYLVMQEADQAEKDGLLTLAYQKYKEGHDTFTLVRSEFPTWNPSLVSYRLKYCSERMSRLEISLSVDAEKLSKPDLVTLVRDLQAQKKTWDRSFSALESKANSLTEQLATAQQEAAELKQARTALAALTNTNATLDAERKELQSSLEKATQDAAAFTKAKQDVDALQAQLTAAEEKAKALAGELEAAKTSQQELTTQIKASQKGQKDTADELAALVEKVATLETQLQKAGEDVGKADLQGSKLQTQVGETQKAYDELNKRFTDVSKKLEHENSEVARLSQKAAQAEQLKKELAEKIREVEEAKLAKAKALAAVRENGEHAKQLVAAQDELKAQAERHAKQLAEAQGKLEAAERHAGQLAEAQGKLKAQAEQHAKQLGTAQDELKAQREKNARSLETATQERDTLAARIAALTAELEKTEDLSAKTDDAHKQLLQAGLSGQEALRLTALPPRVAAEMARLKGTQGTVDLARLEDLVKAERAEEVAKLQGELNTCKGEVEKSKKRIEQLKQDLVARQEAESRLVAERKRRIEQEREVALQEQAREETLHQQLKQAADIEKKGDAEAAIHAYKKVLELTPDSQQALARLGILLTARGQDVEAEHYLGRAFALNPDDTDVLLRLGFSQIRQEKVHMAVSALSRVAALEPKNADARRLLGLACSAIGWSEAAEAEFRNAFRLNSESPDAAYNLAVLLATLDKPRIEEAKEWYEKAKKLGARPDPGLEKCLAQ